MERIKLTQGEEIANSITHGIGAVLSAVALILIILSGNQYKSSMDFVGALIFGISMVLLYSMSTLCHAFALSEGFACKLFRILDHGAIYVLIAGTFTPFCLSVIGGTKGYTMLAIQWVLAFIGIVLRSVFYDKFTAVHVGIYLAMGWSIMLFVQPIAAVVSPTGMLYFFLGGISYTIGVLFYAIRMFKYHHMVWHLFVLGGTTCHFLLIYNFLLIR